jgi:hypothetical protein
VQGVGHAVKQGIKVFAGLRRKGELLGDHVQHILFALGHGQVGIQKMMPQVLRSLMQILHPVGTDRLHDVGFDGTKWRVHLR